MAWSLRTLVLITACGSIAACAHAAPAQLAQEAALPELGEDMPETALAPSAAVAPAKLFSVDTPVGKLCGHPEARAVVDRDLPGLTTRPEYMFFKHMSLRQLQAASNGKMTEATLARVSLDLDALGAPAPVPIVRASAALP